MGIEVHWSETRGSVDFGWGRCVLQAGSDALNLRVEADQADDLERLQELLTRHVERHNSSDQATVRWNNEKLSRS